MSARQPRPLATARPTSRVFALICFSHSLDLSLVLALSVASQPGRVANSVSDVQFRRRNVISSRHWNSLERMCSTNDDHELVDVDEGALGQVMYESHVRPDSSRIYGRIYELDENALGGQVAVLRATFACFVSYPEPCKCDEYVSRLCI